MFKKIVPASLLLFLSVMCIECWGDEKRLTSDCIDLEKMSFGGRNKANRISSSLRKFLDANLTSEQKKREIGEHIAAVGVYQKYAVVIFSRSGRYRWIGDLGGLPLRGEERKILEKNLEKWIASNSEFNSMELFVRFTDECYIPVPWWK